MATATYNLQVDTCDMLYFIKYFKMIKHEFITKTGELRDVPQMKRS